MTHARYGADRFKTRCLEAATPPAGLGTGGARRPGRGRRPTSRPVTWTLLWLCLSVAAWATPPNVLFVAFDDLNDWVGCLGGHPQAHTPNLDRLAARGTVFLNAHCQAPLCNPSRASLLTGLRPSTTGIHGLAPGIREVDRTRQVVTLPQAFTRAGWFTHLSGKIHHDGSIGIANRSREAAEWGPAPGLDRPARPFSSIPDAHPLMDWGPFPTNGAPHADARIADAAIDALRRSDRSRPFFIACGFRLPHVPCYAPPEWFERFPMDDLRMPPVAPDDRSDTPPFSWYLHWKLPEPRLSVLRRHDQWRPLVRSYLASIAFVDFQLGRLLSALDADPRGTNTLVVVWSDHGYHLGEKGISGKNSLWERSTRVPLIIAGPGAAPRGRCREPVELLDLYPTLIELTGLPGVEGLEGHSLVPQLKDASHRRPWPAITTHGRGNHAVRSAHWRFIRYADGSEELYDERADPAEWTNLVGRADLRPIRDEHARWLPRLDVPAAPGSAHRVVGWNPRTRRASWEGAEIRDSDREE